MKIGVFGDSFATEVIDDRYMSDVTRNNESWVVNIRQKGHDITTFGEGATSTYSVLSSIRLIKEVLTR